MSEKELPVVSSNSKNNFLNLIKIPRRRRVTIILAVLALVAGGCAYFIVKNNNDESKKQETGLKQEDRAKLVNLGEVHMNTVNKAFGAAIDGSADAESLRASLYKNGNEISDSMGEVYGDEAKNKFDEAWKIYIDQFFAYIDASKKNDAQGKEVALQTINDGYTHALTSYIAKINPATTDITLRAGLAEHVAGTLRMVEAHLKGDRVTEEAELQAANSHIKAVFGFLGDTAVKGH